MLVLLGLDTAAEPKEKLPCFFALKVSAGFVDVEIVLLLPLLLLLLLLVVLPALVWNDDDIEMVRCPSVFTATPYAPARLLIAGFEI